MEAESLSMFIPMLAIIGAVILLAMSRRYLNQERMAMIDKGLDLQDFKKGKNPFLTLRLALLAVGAGIGLLVAYFLDMAFHMEEVAYFSMLFIFGGLGLVAAYLVQTRQNDDAPDA